MAEREVCAIGILDREEASVQLDALGLSDSPPEGDGFEIPVPGGEPPGRPAPRPAGLTDIALTRYRKVVRTAPQAVPLRI
jgi:hypothetical protein